MLIQTSQQHFVKNEEDRQNRICMLGKLSKNGIVHEQTVTGSPNVLSFELFRKYVFSPSIVPGLHNASLKLLTIHAYALQVIDSVDELKIYLKAICDGLESVEVLYLVLSDEQREAFANLYIRSPFKFPYSKIEQLMSHTSVLVYDWKADKVIEDERLSDRTGIAILHLCNCLFFDENTDFT